MTDHRDAEIVEYDDLTGAIQRTGRRMALDDGRFIWSKAVTSHEPYTHLLCWIPQAHLRDRAAFYYVLVQEAASVGS